MSTLLTNIAFITSFRATFIYGYLNLSYLSNVIMVWSFYDLNFENLKSMIDLWNVRTLLTNIEFITTFQATFVFWVSIFKLRIKSYDHLKFFHPKFCKLKIYDKFMQCKDSTNIYNVCYLILRASRSKHSLKSYDNLKFCHPKFWKF